MIEALSKSIATLYSVFERYPKPRTMRECPRCVTRSDTRALLAYPLLEIPAGRIDAYAFLATTCWGDVDDFRHFLPRVFQVAVTEDLEWSGLEDTFKKLVEAKWPTWPEDEQIALRSFMTSFWKDLLAAYPSVHDCNAGLCALAHANESVNEFLNYWAGALNGPAALHLCDFIREHISRVYLKNELGGVFWTHCPVQASQVVHWMLSTELAQAVRSAFKSAHDEDVLGALVETLEYLHPRTV